MVELPHEDGVRKQHVDSHDMLHDVPFGFVAIAQFVDRSTRTDKPEIGTPSNDAAVEVMKRSQIVGS